MKEDREYFEGFPETKKPVPGVIPLEAHPSGYLTDRGETVLEPNWECYTAGKGTENETKEKED